MLLLLKERLLHCTEPLKKKKKKKNWGGGEGGCSDVES